MNKLLRVAEGILCSSANEYLESNLSSIESVQAYAFACDVELSDNEAETILNICKNWVYGTESGAYNGTNDYYYTVEKPLLGDDAVI